MSRCDNWLTSTTKSTTTIEHRLIPPQEGPSSSYSFSILNENTNQFDILTSGPLTVTVAFFPQTRRPAPTADLTLSRSGSTDQYRFDEPAKSGPASGALAWGSAGEVAPDAGQAQAFWARLGAIERSLAFLAADDDGATAAFGPDEISDNLSFLVYSFPLLRALWLGESGAVAADELDGFFRYYACLLFAMWMFYTNGTTGPASVPVAIFYRNAISQAENREKVSRFAAKFAL